MLLIRKNSKKPLIETLKESLTNGLFSEEQFHRILKIERERSDRSLHQFSLILIDLEYLENNRSLNHGALDKIINRVREIDEIGLYDRSHIGILLPYTTGEGAHKLVENLVATLELKTPNSVFSVYTYPSR